MSSELKLLKRQIEREISTRESFLDDPEYKKVWYKLDVEKEILEWVLIQIKAAEKDPL